MQAWGIEQLVLALYVARVPKAGFGQIAISNRLTKLEGEYDGPSCFSTTIMGVLYIYNSWGLRDWNDGSGCGNLPTSIDVECQLECVTSTLAYNPSIQSL